MGFSLGCCRLPRPGCYPLFVKLDLSNLLGLSCDSRVGASRGFCSGHSLPRSLVLSLKVITVRKRPTCADLGTQQCVGKASVRLLSRLVPLRCGRHKNRSKPLLSLASDGGV